MKNPSLGKSTEDYLESILILKEKNGYVRSVDISEQLNITKPSVSTAVKRLRENGFIEMNSSGFISFTTEGRKVAERIYTRHKTLADFFIRLGVNSDVATDDACKIEHDISEETFAAICTHAKSGHLPKSKK